MSGREGGEAAINILSVISILPARAARHCTYNLPLTRPDEARRLSFKSRPSPVFQFEQSLSGGWCSLASRPSRSRLGGKKQWLVAGQVKSSPCSALISPTASQCQPFPSPYLPPALLFAACQQQRVTCIHRQSNEPALSTI